MSDNIFAAIQSLLVLILIAACQPEPTAALPEQSMVVVPAGWFLMGQNEGPRSNQPQRQVYLDRFVIDKTEVTKEAFARFVQEEGYPIKGWAKMGLDEEPKEPVVGVLWSEAAAYCRWAGKRLPTEAEWEKAARGTDGRRYPWGDHWEVERANVAENGYGRAVAVGTYPAGASPYGALDMAGNAAEWVADYFDFEYYRYAPDHNPVGPDQVMDHVLRGGSWASSRGHAQTFFRDSSHSVKPNMRVGFRCARSTED